MKIRSSKNQLHISPDADVARIEIEEIAPPDEDDDSLIPSYYRTVRITPVGADEVIELFLTAESPEALQVREVTELGPAEEPKPDNLDWLIPKVYKGKSEYDPEAEDPS